MEYINFSDLRTYLITQETTKIKHFTTTNEMVNYSNYQAQQAEIHKYAR